MGEIICKLSYILHAQIFYAGGRTYLSQASLLVTPTARYLGNILRHTKPSMRHFTTSNFSNMPYSYGQLLSVIVISMVSGSVSFIASFTLIVMILMSADKLKTPLRRLIVGVSVSDVIASFSNVLNPIMIPSGVLAYGNQGPCEAVAFSNHFGAFASMLYTLSLCIYYVHVIKYNTSDRDFATRIEPWLHGISIGYPLLGSIVNLAVGNFNSMGLICWIYSQPLYCADDPDVECIRGANAEAYKLIFAMMPLFVSFIGSVYVMVVISLTVIKQERRNARFRFQDQQTSDGIN